MNPRSSSVLHWGSQVIMSLCEKLEKFQQQDQNRARKVAHLKEGESQLWVRENGYSSPALPRMGWKARMVTMVFKQMSNLRQYPKSIYIHKAAVSVWHCPLCAIGTGMSHLKHTIQQSSKADVVVTIFLHDRIKNRDIKELLIIIQTKWTICVLP